MQLPLQHLLPGHQQLKALPVLLLLISSMLIAQAYSLEAAKAVLPNGQGELWASCKGTPGMRSAPVIVPVESAAQLHRKVRVLQQKHQADTAVFFVLSTQDALDLDSPLLLDVEHTQRHCFVFGVKSNNTRPLTLRCRGAKSAVIIKSPLVSMSRLSIDGCSDSGMKILTETGTPFGATSLQHIIFHNNSARNGGGLQLGEGVLANLNNVQFTSNTAEKGGAVYAKSACLRVGADQLSLKACPSVSSCPSVSAFVGNTARQGGGVYIENSSCRSLNQQLGNLGSDDDKTFLLQEAWFDGNSAYDGGAVFMDVVPGGVQQMADGKPKDIINVRDVVLKNNTAGQRGGALFITNAFSVTFESANLTNNTAGLSGGAMWVSSNLFGVLKLSSTQMQGNKVTYPLTSQATTTGLSHKSGLPSQPEPSQHRQAFDLGGGGGVWASNAITVVIDSLADGGPSKFAHNTAGHNGGAFACIRCIRVDIKDTSFESNSACSGGAVALDGLIADSSSISNSRFKGNSASLTDSCMEVNKPTGASPKAKDVQQGNPKCMACGAGGGGALCSTSVVDITSSTFQANRAAIGGGAYLMQERCSAASCLSNISSCTFDSNNATMAGGGLFITSLQSAFLPVADATYQESINHSFPQSSNLTRSFQDVKSDCQSAAASRLPIYLAPEYMPPTAMNQTATTQKPRTGQGSAIQSSSSTAVTLQPALHSRPQLQNTFSNNQVLSSSGYGQSVATSAACILPAGTLHKPNVVRNNEQFNLTVNLYDAFLQRITLRLPGTDLIFSNDPQKQELTQLSPAAFASTATADIVSTVSVFGDYGINTLKVMGSLYGQPAGEGEVELNIRKCQVGEVTFKTVGARGICRQCSSGGESEYSFNSNNTACMACPHRAACSGTTLVPHDAYWHASPRSPRIFYCPLRGACDHLPQHLPPTFSEVSTRSQLLQRYQQGLASSLSLNKTQTQEYLQLQCSPGYQGNVCGTCATGYGRTGQRCKRCGSRVASYIFITLLKMAEGLVLVGMVMVRVLFRAAQASPAVSPTTEGGRKRRRSEGQQDQEVEVQPAAACGMHLLELPRHLQLPLQQLGHQQLKASWIQGLQAEAASCLSALLEMVIVYAQILGLIMSTQLSWSERVASFFSSLRFTEGTFVWLSPDCLLPSSSKRLTGYWRVGAITLTPGVVVVMVCVAWFMFTMVRPNSRFSYSLQHIIPMVAIQAANFYYPSVVSTTLSIFTCMSLDPEDTFFDGSRVSSQASSRHGWWKQDYDVKCFTGRHTAFAAAFGVPMLLLLAVGIPYYVLMFLWKSHKKQLLRTQSYQEKFGHMYVDFEPKHYMWYGMRFGLFLALSIAVQGLSYYGPQWQLLAVATVLSAFLWVHLWCQPYRSPLMNAMYALVLAGALATVYLCIPLSRDGGAMNRRHWVPILMVLVNSILVALLLLMLLPGLLKFRHHLSTFASTAAVAITVIARRGNTYKSFIRDSRSRLSSETFIREVPSSRSSTKSEELV